MGDILTLDVGTTSVKACLFDRGLRLAAQADREYPLETAGVRVEAEAAVYLEAVAACLAALPDMSGVRAVALTTQGETLIPADGAGTPLHKAVVWLDSRAGDQAAALAAKLNRQRFYEETGLPEPGGSLPLCKLMWFREAAPEVYRRTEKFLLLEDFLLHWLTGRFVTEKSLLTSTGYFSLRQDGYWAEALALAGIDGGKLPAPLECGAVVGPILPERAAALGLPPQAVVVAGAMDQVAAALAAGCTVPGAVCETTGTAMVAAAYTDAPHFARDHHVTIYRHAMAGSYLYLPISNTAGMALKWLRDAFFQDLEGDYAAMDRLAEEAGAGAGGLVCLPFLAGEADPVSDAGALGCFYGARLSTGRGDFARAVLEAVAFQLRDFLDMLEALGCPAETVCSLGGGSRSPLWMQIKADVCRRPFRTLHTAQATSLGAALLAARALGLSPPAAGEGDRYLPQEEPAETYQTHYRRYRRLSAALRQMRREEEAHTWRRFDHEL